MKVCCRLVCSTYRFEDVDKGIIPAKDGDLGSLFQLVKEISVPRSDTVMSHVLVVMLS
jgi:hypothetical protein